MKRRIISCLLAVSVLSVFINSSAILYAQDFASNEGYYQNLCSQYNPDPETTKICKDFRNYLDGKSEDLKNQVASLNKDIDLIRNDMSNIQNTINQQNQIIDSITKKIEANNVAITKIQASISELNQEIEKTQKDIDKRDEQIKQRMISEQATLGTNVYIEFLMGAKDIVDLVRIADGLQRITENDKEVIAALEVDKQKIAQQKGEQQRLKEDQEKAKRQNEEDRKIQEQAKQAQESLLRTYQAQEADLLQKMREANAAISAIKDKIIAVDSVKYVESNGWARPVRGAVISAHTWEYPGGGFHAGMDFASRIGTPVYAPIGGVIVYANNPVSTNSGYLGNFSGHPSGGGNTIHMVGRVNGTTYGVSFFHLAQENFAVQAGMAVTQNQQIATVGNSGNTSGPHCHVEVINLGNISTDEAIARFRNSGADFAWGTGWNTTSTACSNKGAPCRERPEKFFGS